MNSTRVITSSLAMMLFAPLIFAQGSTDFAATAGRHARRHNEQSAAGRQQPEEKRLQRDRPFPPPAQSWSIATLILGRPTDGSVTISVVPSETLEAYLEFVGNGLTSSTVPLLRKAREPVQQTLTGLSRDTEYAYRLRYRDPGESAWLAGPQYRFHTQRAPGSAFMFEIMGDSHPERSPKQNDPALYAQVLTAAASDRPDFFLTIGDDFSVDTLSVVNALTVEDVYRKQLPYLGLVAHSAPLFLVNGNHEQAARCNLDGTPNNLAVWAQTTRNRLFPLPAPDGFFTGDSEQVPDIGLLRDYYSWTWGDALFVVIDPYWHSAQPVDNAFGGRSKSPDLWSVTLGEAQYRWLQSTLLTSQAKYKFVFAHHVNGTGRGGIEEADLYEWGGHNPRGEWEFDTRRPGWEMPIHQLMAKAHVTIFFQGHDHIFARQQKDGITYQTLPEPADPTYTLYNQQAYVSGDILPNSGRVRVSVGAASVRVEYTRAQGGVAFEYTIPAPEASAPDIGHK